MGGIENKRELVKEVLRRLNEGMDPGEARKLVVEKAGTISSAELFEIENALIKEGTPPEEIKKFCNVHAMLFENIFENGVSDPESPVHPVTLFKLENREIERLAGEGRKFAASGDFEGLRKTLEELQKVDTHYQRKEQIIFPFLERKGFFGPSQVMWGKDDEVRGLLKNALEKLGDGPGRIDAASLDTLFGELEGMVFKEENVFLPTCLEKLSREEWTEVFKQSSEPGYVFIQPPREVFEAADIVRRSGKEATFSEGFVCLPTGRFSPEELRTVLNALPFDITFIDKDDRVRFYSEGKDRVFLRTPAALGREVRNCHPPKSLAYVEKVIDDLRSGRRDHHEFRINFAGKFVHIRYFAVRDEFGAYQGILEVTQDITGIVRMEGEKRLVDE